MKSEPNVRKFYPNVRLKTMVGDPRGQRCGDMLERAAERVEEIRETCVAGLDEKIERIHALSQSEDETVVAQCYQVGNEIFAIAGSFGLEELSGAAHSLCSLLANASGGVIPRPAVRVHVDAMRALRRREIAGNKTLRVATLNELRKMVARLNATRSAQNPTDTKG